MGQLGFSEIIIIFVIALLVFGPKKLPELGKSLGKGLREFRRATDDLKANWDEQIRDVNEATTDVKKDFKEAEQSLKQDMYASNEPPPQNPELYKENPDLHNEETSSNARQN